MRLATIRRSASGDRYSGLSGSLALLATSLIWGVTFVILKVTVETIPPFSLAFGKFGIALALLLVVSWNKLRHSWRACLPASAFLGLLLAAAFILQLWGLQRTSVSDAGFITGLSVVLVALLDLFVNKRWPSWYTLLGFMSALVGLIILSLERDFVVSIGNILVLACAIPFGLHVFYTDRYSKLFETEVLTTEQMGVAALATFCGLIFNQETHFEPSTYAILGIIYVGIVATALAFFLQTWGQKQMQATNSAVLLAAEPVFSAIFAVVILSEPVTSQLVVGGALVIVGMIVSSLHVKDRF